MAIEYQKEYQKVSYQKINKVSYQK
ncbi:hypothetical protein CCACVL1_24606, partial [Corchorus capsularis]